MPVSLLVLCTHAGCPTHVSSFAAALVLLHRLMHTIKIDSSVARVCVQHGSLPSGRVWVRAVAVTATECGYERSRVVASEDRDIIQRQYCRALRRRLRRLEARLVGISSSHLVISSQVDGWPGRQSTRTPWPVSMGGSSTAIIDLHTDAVFVSVSTVSTGAVFVALRQQQRHATHCWHMSAPSFFSSFFTGPWKRSSR